MLSKRNYCKRSLVMWWWGMRGREASYDPTIRNSSFLVKLCLWIVNFTGVSQLLSPVGGTSWICPLPRRQAGQALVKQFSLRASLVNNWVLCCISKWPLFSCCWKHEGIFLWYLLWESGQAPSGKSHNIAGAPYDWVNLEFFIQTCPHWASSNPSIPVQVSLHWCWFPRWLLLMSICSSEVAVAVLCICLSVSSISGTVVCPLSCGAKKNCWFFSLFSLLLFRMELRLPSSLYEELENPLGLPTSNIILRKYIFSNSQYFWLK